jgi:putative intracellular protease/amidase
MRKAAIFYTNEFADWEGAFIAPWLKRNNWEVSTFSNLKNVTSIGGMNLKVDHDLDSLTQYDPDLLILIGGNTWVDFQNEKLVKIISDYLSSDKKVAAICGAVDFLARNGLLNDHMHTGNSKDIFLNFDNYQNGDNFVASQSVADRNLVTANGTGEIEFAVNVAKMVEPEDETAIDKYFDMYKLGYYNYIDKYGTAEF